MRVSSLALKATFVCTELMGWTRAALERMMPAECADFFSTVDDINDGYSSNVQKIPGYSWFFFVN